MKIYLAVSIALSAVFQVHLAQARPDCSGTGLNRLGCAILHRDISEFKRIIRKANVEVAGDRYSDSPLCMAAENGMDEMVKVLLQKGADVNRKGTITPKTALSCAVGSWNFSAAELLVDAGANLDVCVYTSTRCSFSVLRSALSDLSRINLRAAAKSFVVKMIRGGADLANDPSGFGSAPVLETLVDLHDHLPVSSPGQEPIPDDIYREIRDAMLASPTATKNLNQILWSIANIADKDPVLMQWFLDHHVSDHWIPAWGGREGTTLNALVKHDQLRTLEMLVSAGISLGYHSSYMSGNGAYFHSLPPLSFAARECKIDALKILLASPHASAEINNPPPGDWSAVQYAQQFKCAEAETLLRAAGGGP